MGKDFSASPFHLLNGDYDITCFIDFERIKLKKAYKVPSKFHDKEVIPYQ